MEGSYKNRILKKTSISITEIFDRYLVLVLSFGKSVIAISPENRLLKPPFKLSKLYSKIPMYILNIPFKVTYCRLMDVSSSLCVCRFKWQFWIRI